MTIKEKWEAFWEIVLAEAKRQHVLTEQDLNLLEHQYLCKGSPFTFASPPLISTPETEAVIVESPQEVSSWKAVSVGEPLPAE